MKEMETIALCVLFLFCSSHTQGENVSNSSTSLQNLPMPSISSPVLRSSTPKLETLSGPTLHNASSEGDRRTAGDLSANDTLSQSYNDTTNSTVTPGFPTGAAGNTVNSFAPISSISVPGNLTDSHDGSNLQAVDNQTSTASNTTRPTTNTTTTAAATTPLPKGKARTSTLAPSTRFETPSASIRPQITTSPLAASTQSKGKSSTVATKFTFTPTTTTTTTTTTTSTTTTATQTTEFRSTPVLAKARVENPSELNVGDDTEYGDGFPSESGSSQDSGTSMDPLLAGLVSVFVVTAAIVALLFFLKFRHRNERPEFRRLQDLPMDDMMEDTPLSMYSY